MRAIVAAVTVMLVGCRAKEATPATSPEASTAVSTPASVPSAADATTTGAAPQTWSFDADKAGEAPAGFSFGRTGEGREGTWVVRAEPGAPSGANVLAQTDADTTDDRFPVAFANEPVLKDLELSVRCKPISGKVDQACGMVFRLRDAKNYYLTRANALEDNVRFYTVKEGRRQQLASFSGKVTSGAWHDYRVVAQGDHFEIWWDGKKILDHHDKTFTEAGKVGVWTKADSVTYFDDLRVKASP